MNINGYRERLIEKKIDLYLEAFGAVCIEGPKWCGKTWTSVYHSKSSLFLGDPSGNFQNRELARTDLEAALKGKFPHLIDEWQEVPPIWDAVRFKVDSIGQKGLYILTGSSTPNHKGVLHSGTGRIARIRMSTMSLYESGDSTGEVSLIDLFDGKQPNKITGEVELMRLINLTIRGGWPASIGLKDEVAFRLPLEYINAIIEDDVYRLDGKKRDGHKLRLLLHSLARNESTTVSINTLKRDIKEYDSQNIDEETLAEYLDAFSRLFVFENQPPFSANLRSSVRVKQQEKRHFVDPSLACALLGATPKMLLNDLNTFGFLFEALCERDLRIYAQANDGKLYHYQDYKNREIDAVVELSDGRWGAFEIKLGMHQVDAAAANLLNIRKSLEDSGGNVPDLLCVICGMSSAAYQRSDGVYVVPITALRA